MTVRGGDSSAEVVLRALPQPGFAQWSRGLVRFIRSKPLGAFGGFLVIVMSLVAIFAPWLSPYDPIAMSGSDVTLAPSWSHPFGTDQRGSDILSRVIWGARVSMLVALVATTISIVVKVGIGTISAYLGGTIDSLLQRGVDTVMVFPFLVLMLSLGMLFGTSMWTLSIVLGVVTGIRSSRVIRSSVLSIKENQYIEGARAIGCSQWRIMLLHIIPNIFAPIMILATVGWGGIILTETSLSFLGYGVPPPLPSWGRMVSGENRLYFEAAPWIVVFPGLAIAVTVFGFNMLGDALRDVLDPRLRGSR